MGEEERGRSYLPEMILTDFTNINSPISDRNSSDSV